MNKKVTVETRKSLHTAIVEQYKSVVVTIPSVSPCTALCYSKFSGNKTALNECLDNCRAIQAIQMVVERLHQEFFTSVLDAVWAGGDIDPLPFEKRVRENFSRPI